MNDFLKLGEHFICELSGCDQILLLDNQRLQKLFTQLVRESQLSIIYEGQFDFTPYGFSGYLLLEESHASIHVWPEYGYCALDVFTCNLEIDVTPLFTAAKEAFAADGLSVQRIDRGIPAQPVWPAINGATNSLTGRQSQ